MTIIEKDGTLRQCQDYWPLREIVESDSGELGDMQAMFDGLYGMKYFTNIGVASGFLQAADRQERQTQVSFS